MGAAVLTLEWSKLLTAELSIHQQNRVTLLQGTELGLTSSPHFINISSSQLTSATRLETEKKDTIKIFAHSE